MDVSPQRQLSRRWRGGDRIAATDARADERAAALFSLLFVSFLLLFVGFLAAAGHHGLNGGLLGRRRLRRRRGLRLASRDARVSPFAAQKPSPSEKTFCKAASGGGVRGRSLLFVQPIEHAPAVENRKTIYIKSISYRPRPPVLCLRLTTVLSQQHVVSVLISCRVKCKKVGHALPPASGGKTLANTDAYVKLDNRCKIQRKSTRKPPHRC